MLRRARVLALPLGFALALAIGACGSSDTQESGATVEPSPLTAQTTAPTTTTTATTTSVPTTTTPPVATVTTPATTPTSTQPTGGATTTQPTTGFAGGARGAPSGSAAGCPTAVGGFIRDVRGTDCGVAHSVATSWYDAIRGGAAADSTIDAAGYSCSGTLAGERASVTCSGSGGTVSFTASP
jgi:hypothetical protein